MLKDMQRKNIEHVIQACVCIPDLRNVFGSTTERLSHMICL